MNADPPTPRLRRDGWTLLRSAAVARCAMAPKSSFEGQAQMGEWGRKTRRHDPYSGRTAHDRLERACALAPRTRANVMNASPSTTKRASCRNRRKVCSCLLQLGAVAFAAGLVASCATSSSRPHGESGQAAEAASQWVRVKANPPTWYPRGTPADQPTDCRDGEWVYTEDVLGSRYFIPVRGISAERRKLLRREALAARSPRKVRRIAGEDAARVVGMGALTLFTLSPLGWFPCMAYHGIGPDRW